MDALAFIGLLLAILALVVGQQLEGGNIASLLNGPAFIIVLGGTLGAVMLQTPIEIFKRALQQFRWVFFPPQHDLKAGIAKIVNWSHLARKEGLLGLENVEHKETDDFTRKGLHLLVDGAEPEKIRSTMMVELEVEEQLQLQSAKVYESLGGYAPTLGIIGAVIGLIQVMSNLSDPGALGAGIATAFVATVYGVAFANLLFLPVSNKMKVLIMYQSRYREMLIEGFLAVAEGENPRVIENKLTGFIEQKKR